MDSTFAASQRALADIFFGVAGLGARQCVNLACAGQVSGWWLGPSQVILDERGECIGVLAREIGVRSDCRQVYLYAGPSPHTTWGECESSPTLEPIDIVCLEVAGDERWVVKQGREHLPRVENFLPADWIPGGLPDPWWVLIAWKVEMARTLREGARHLLAEAGPGGWGADA